MSKMVDPVSPPPPYRGSSDTAGPSSPPRDNSKPQMQSPTPKRPVRHRRKQSMLDELLPLPTPSSSPSHSANVIPVARRTGSVAVVGIFLISIIFLAATSGGPSVPRGFRALFGPNLNLDLGGDDWSSEDVSTPSLVNSTKSNSESIDFDKYSMIKTLKDKDFDITSPERRLIFLGDVHGSMGPLKRLMKKLNYDKEKDRLVHVGDLVAKGDHNLEVLDWMETNEVIGVRGNHDQPVVQWHTWMKWAGGENYDDFINSIGGENADNAEALMTAQGKMYPKDWEWKGEHWHIARSLKSNHYDYLLKLPLALHIPSLHTIVVHAGLLPHNPLKSLEDPAQPLVAASETQSFGPDKSRLKEELSLLLDIPQNTDPWTLMNMRSIQTKGKKKGKITKSGKKGTPWSEVWQEEMERCEATGPNARDLEDDLQDDEQDGALHEEDSLTVASRKKGKKMKKIKCSPVNVIYGHAAARGLDIKDFSKGIDTGCVYGRELTALVLGDTSGLKGEQVQVGEAHGLLVSEPCKKHGH